MKFPFVHQRDIMQCGAACLCMICRYWGMYIPLVSVSEMCGYNKDGVSLFSLSNVAESLGLDNETYFLSVNDLGNIKGPCILHWNQNHFVVLYKINKNKYYIADPSKGCITLEQQTFENNWISNNGEGKGVVMLFAPNELFEQKCTQWKSTKDVPRMDFLLKHISAYKKYFIQILLGLILGCFLQLALPVLTQIIVDKGIRERNINIIWLILIGELLIVLGRSIADFIRNWLVLHISMRTNIELVSDFFVKLLRLPMNFFEKRLIGDLIQRLGDHSRVQSFLSEQLLSAFFAVLSIIVFSGILLYYDWKIMMIFLIGSAMYVGWIALFLHQRKMLDNESFEQQSQNQSITYQFLSNIQEIKLQDCEDRRRWEWEDKQADLFKIRIRTLKLQQLQDGGGLCINELKNLIVTAFTATAVVNGVISFGEMLAVQFIIGQINSPIDSIMSFIYSYQDVLLSMQRINDIHDLCDEDCNRHDVVLNRVNNDIILKNIVFKYDLDSMLNTIDGVSCVIPQGKITAIVGSSGSGKTTLIKLLLGYYKILSGDIMIGNHNFNNLSLKNWRKKCGVVMQESRIFSESIANNIVMGNSEIDLNRLEYASQIANLNDFVDKLPLKFDTIIGNNGIGLSEGQKQRILIARAVYKDPDFVFLDEATNSLDAENESAIIKSLFEFYKKRTVVIVAHRLSTIRDADQILVMENGMICEMGKYDELLERKGVFYKLVKRQIANLV